MRYCIPLSFGILKDALQNARTHYFPPCKYANTLRRANGFLLRVQRQASSNSWSRQSVNAELQEFALIRQNKIKSS